MWFQRSKNAKLSNLIDTSFSSNGDKIIIPTKAKIHNTHNTYVKVSVIFFILI